MSDAVFGGSITPLAANAPVHADGDDCYGWHIDADPALVPPSPWTDLFGRYPNRLAGAPRFVTALVYLSPEWRDAWGARLAYDDMGSILAALSLRMRGGDGCSSGAGAAGSICRLVGSGNGSAGAAGTG